MTALVLTPIGASLLPAWVLYVLAAISLVALAVVAKQVGRRIALAILLAAAMSAPFTVLHAEDDDFMMRIRCKTYEKYSAEWWVFGCWQYDDEEPPAMTATTPEKKPVPREKRK